MSHVNRFQGIEIQYRNIYLDMPTVGYQGFKSAYRPQTTQIQHRKDPFFNINPMRPRLNERDMRSTDGFKQLSTGFQAAAVSQTTKKERAASRNEMRIPVVGYTGHRMGQKSQNFYGKNYRDCAI